MLFIRFRSVVAITLASHARGPRFEPGRNHFNKKKYSNRFPKTKEMLTGKLSVLSSKLQRTVELKQISCVISYT